MSFLFLTSSSSSSSAGSSMANRKIAYSLGDRWAKNSLSSTRRHISEKLFQEFGPRSPASTKKGARGGERRNEEREEERRQREEKAEPSTRVQGFLRRQNVATPGGTKDQKRKFLSVVEKQCRKCGNSATFWHFTGQESASSFYFLVVNHTA